ncbi:MAG: hypothetical protein HY290_26995 [Planctomycetia bacterium]|nr:hypothetical protein [Planctomycetia bacterium]
MTTETIQNLHEIDDYARARVKYKAKQLAGRWGTSKSDRPDIEQSLLISLWKALPHFDADVGEWKPFVRAVLERTADKIKRRCLCQKRGSGVVPESLSEDVVDPVDGMVDEAGELIVADVLFQRLRVPARDHVADVDLAQDLEHYVSQLSEHHRWLCRGLMTKHVSDLATESGIPRSTLVDEIERLRTALEFLGFRFNKPE